jgi:formylglycine-generating enzyme required for sulfatase activity
MPIDFDFWKTDLSQRIQHWLPRMRKAGVTTSYGLLCAASLAPVIAAWQQGDMTMAFAFAGLLGSIGANLLTNVIQSVKDKTDEEMGHQILQSAESDPKIREDLDKLLQKLNAVPLLKSELGGEDQAWFLNTLRSELSRLRSSIQIEGTVDRSVLNSGNMVGTFTNTGTFRGNVYMGEAARDPAEIQRIYCEMLVKSTGHVYLQGLMPGTGTPESSQRSVALAHVYIDLDVEGLREGSGKSKEAPDVPDWLKNEEEQNTALKALLANPKMVLLGDPGSGKSTFVRFISHCLAQHLLQPQAGWLKRLEDWPTTWPDPLPLMVILRDFAARLPQKLPEPQVCHLMDFIKERLKEQNMAFTTDFLESQLEQGRALVMLDGLDEVSDSQQRLFVLGAARAFMEHYSKNAYLITCRILSYQPPHKKNAPDLRLTELPAFTLAPFSPEKTERFIDAWYTEIGLPENAEGLKLALQKPDTQLSALASNPLLLTEMAVAHIYLGKLPDERVRLYDAVVNLLLYRWDDQKFGGKQDALGLTQLLKKAGRNEFDLKLAIAQLALEAQAGGSNGEQKLADISDGKLLRKLAELSEEEGLAWAGAVLDLIQKRAGLLIEREPGVYTFPHRTFQEYMAGVALACDEGFVALAKAKALLGDTWRLVIILAGGYIDQINGHPEKALVLVDELCPEEDCAADPGWRAAWLAGDILLEIGLKRSGNYRLGKTVINRVRNCLVSLLQAGGLSPVERARAGDTLACLGDLRFDPEAYFLPKEDRLGFVKIPAGEFIMGSAKKIDKEAYDDEEPQHRVKLPEYYIARYPVTVAQFAAFVDRTGYDKANPTYRNDSPTRPVRNVTWRDAIAYCEWLDQTLRARTDLPVELQSKLAQGWRIALPSEAEWEKAARGVDGRIYPWGKDYDPKRANISDTGIDDTSAVGCFPGGVSPYGVLDLIGNVWEWTRSEFKPYPYNPHDGREELQSDNSRVLRGASFNYVREYARCAARLSTTSVSTPAAPTASAAPTPAPTTSAFG